MVTGPAREETFPAPPTSVRRTVFYCYVAYGCEPTAPNGRPVTFNFSFGYNASGGGGIVYGPSSFGAGYEVYVLSQFLSPFRARCYSNIDFHAPNSHNIFCERLGSLATNIILLLEEIRTGIRIIEWDFTSKSNKLYCEVTRTAFLLLPTVERFDLEYAAETLNINRMVRFST